MQELLPAICSIAGDCCFSSKQQGSAAAYHADDSCDKPAVHRSATARSTHDVSCDRSLLRHGLNASTA